MDIPYEWILYADPSVHTSEVRLVTNAGLESFIHVQDVRLAPGDLPSWMDVMPVLLNTESRLAHRGPSCIKKLVSIDLPPEHSRRLIGKKKKAAAF